MADILHRIGITVAPEDVYTALTTVDGLSRWWTEETDGDASLGGVVRFRFVPGGFDMKVLETSPAERVLWEVVDGPEEWIGTQISFDLKQEGEYTIVLFKHEGWREPVEFMSHCSTKWATFLMSLKRLLETGAGEPAPYDVQISNWH
ncbi:SRPBCC domain-containing protein [Streptomyces yaanensis]|uniref:SRPBCC domain-containing protein n=1 Tax=Streptomyces yaanensis TaxID=1142239 RepID=A0ABV7SI69_9ACTN|nr:SRPBCC domain-containing protein [Streptomyces sp. CGMCC 4.7035]WNC01652.1 SRPBCC domain-containing protein [Streptomyces sp. CGMCC 4.7035]